MRRTQPRRQHILIHHLLDDGDHAGADFGEKVHGLVPHLVAHGFSTHAGRVNRQVGQKRSDASPPAPPPPSRPWPLPGPPPQAPGRTRHHLKDRLLQPDARRAHQGKCHHRGQCLHLGPVRCSLYSHARAAPGVVSKNRPCCCSANRSVMPEM